MADDDQLMGTEHSAHTQAVPPASKLLWYEIQSVLGQGGFGITYLARDPNLDQDVAIKEYLPSAFAARASDGQVKPLTPEHEDDYRWGLERFIDEGRTLARFDHPGIVRVLSVFEENSTAYLVMRYEKGEAMSAILKRERTIAEPQLLRIMHEIMDGLAQVHEAGFIHRDIKPANIYIRENGSAVLLDFGAARQAMGVQTQTLTTLVSPGYAPFEQYYSNGTAQGPWTDIYALGATAYRSITGKAPLPAVDRSQQILNGELDNFITTADIGIEGYSPRLLRAVDKALAFRDTERPRSIAEWREVLDGSAGQDFKVAEVIAVDQTSVKIPAANHPDTDYPATEVLDDDEMPTRVADIATNPNGRYYAMEKWFNWKTIAGAAVVFIALFVIAPKDREQADTKIIENAAQEQIRSKSGVDEVAVIPVKNPEGLEAVAHKHIQSMFVVENDANKKAAEATEKRSHRINVLLAQAETDIAALRLTTPPGYNAFEKFNSVLALDPSNETAKRGIVEIVEKYVELAENSARKNDLATAGAYIERAAAIQPDHPMVRAATTELASRVAAQQRDYTIAEQARRVTDESTRRIRSSARALSKKTYRKAQSILHDALR